MTTPIEQVLPGNLSRLSQVKGYGAEHGWRRGKAEEEIGTKEYRVEGWLGGKEGNTAHGSWLILGVVIAE